MGSGDRNDSNTALFARIGEKKIFDELDVHHVQKVGIKRFWAHEAEMTVNKVGDKALGSAFCTFLKSIRASHAGPVPPGSGEPFFPPAVRRTKEWTDYLRCVRQAMRN